jgi:hypothetical protein
LLLQLDLKRDVAEQRLLQFQRPVVSQAHCSVSTPPAQKNI